MTTRQCRCDDAAVPLDEPQSERSVSSEVFYRHNGVELALPVQSNSRDLWSLRDRWSDTNITFSGPELASLRDALNRLDLTAATMVDNTG